MSTETPIVIVEDQGGLALALQSRIFSDFQINQRFRGRAKVVDSIQRLREWLDAQPVGFVQLLILDWSVRFGLSTQALGFDLRTHQALSSTAIIIGYSGHDEAEESFRQFGADGFISKNRPFAAVADDIMYIVAQREHGCAWTTLN